MVAERDVKIELYRTMIRIRTFESGARRLVKEGHTRHIDLAVALSMACAECLRLNIG